MSSHNFNSSHKKGEQPQYGKKDSETTGQHSKVKALIEKQKEQTPKLESVGEQTQKQESLGEHRKKLVEAALRTSSHSALEGMRSYSDDPNWLQGEPLSHEEFKNLRLREIKDLSLEEVKQIKRIRESIPMPEQSTLLSKVITGKQREDYLSNGERHDTTAGFIGRAQDTKGLHTSMDYIRVNRLDYEVNGKLAFTEDQERLTVIRFTTLDVSALKIPYGGLDGKDLANMSEATGMPETEMVQQKYPFTGNGFTASQEEITSPEYKTKPGRALQFNKGAAMYDIYRDGREVLAGVYDGDGWVKVTE